MSWKRRGKRVGSTLSAPPITVQEDTPVADIAKLMTFRKIMRLLVVRGAKLIGIVSRADIVRTVALGEQVSLPTPFYEL